MFRVATRLAAIASLAAVKIGAASAQSLAHPLLKPTTVSHEVQVEINDLIDVRAFTNAPLQLSGGAFATNKPQAEQVELRSLGTFVDVRPFQNPFILSGGLYSGDLTRADLASAHIRPAGVKAGHEGGLQMSVRGEGFAPYLGIGFDSSRDRQDRVDVKIMAGALFAGTPDIVQPMRGGPLSGDAVLMQQMEQQRQWQADDKDVHPVLQMGVTLRF